MKLDALHEVKMKLSKKTGMLLKHGPTGDYHVQNEKNLESLEGLFPEDELDGNLYVTNCRDLTSLKGMPRVIHGNLHITMNPNLKSLEHCATRAEAFVCSHHSFTSFEHMPRQLSEFICNQNNCPTPVTSLRNIHKMIDSLSLRLQITGLKSHILGVLLIPGNMKYFNIDYGDNRWVSDLIEQYLTRPFGMDRVLDCQEAMIARGFTEFAKL